MKDLKSNTTGYSPNTNNPKGTTIGVGRDVKNSDIKDKKPLNNFIRAILLAAAGLGTSGVGVMSAFDIKPSEIPEIISDALSNNDQKLNLQQEISKNSLYNTSGTLKENQTTLNNEEITNYNEVIKSYDHYKSTKDDAELIANIKKVDSKTLARLAYHSAHIATMTPSDKELMTYILGVRPETKHMPLVIDRKETEKTIIELMSEGFDYENTPARSINKLQEKDITKLYIDAKPLENKTSQEITKTSLSH